MTSNSMTFTVTRTEREMDRCIALARVIDAQPGRGIVLAEDDGRVDDLYTFLSCYRRRTLAVARWTEAMPERAREENCARFERGLVRVLVASPSLAENLAARRATFILQFGGEPNAVIRRLDGIGGYKTTLLVWLPSPQPKPCPTASRWRDPRRT